MSIRSLNLIWERRIRGSYPVARYALDDDGTLALAVPRPLEARTYDLTRLALDGAAEQRFGFAVETLLKLEGGARADSLVGMTSDDLYLFHAGSKQRFLSDRRLIYIDAALSADGQRLATLFSDIAGASFAIAYGEIGGRVVWSLDLDVTPTVIAIGRDGARVAFGAEGGTVHLMDAARRHLWEFGQPEPVSAIACSSDGATVAYGTLLGGVGLVDSGGTRRWEARLPGAVTALALAGDGHLCAALCRPEGSPTASRLFCILNNGQIAWDYDAELALVGLTVSSDGRYLATGTRGGSVSVYEVVPGAAVEGADLDALRQQVAARLDAGESELAVVALRALLAADPADVEAGEQRVALRAQLRETHLARARELRQVGDLEGAAAALDATLQDDPLDVETAQLLRDIRHERGREYLERARACRLEEDDDAAENALLAALAIDPDAIEARRHLRDLRAKRAEANDREADARRAENDLEGAVSALERAQAQAPTRDRANRLERARIDLEFEIGMAAYNAKRYPEAVFQFKKVLQAVPDHAEAKRYLGYAQKFARDSSTDSLNDRFSRLE